MRAYTSLNDMGFEGIVSGVFVETCMTPDVFRLLAMRLPNVEFGSNLGNHEFRVGTKVFASLGSPVVGQALIKLTPRSQAQFVALAPGAFAAAPGGQGARGGTIVKLAMADATILERALEAAHQKASGKG